MSCTRHVENDHRIHMARSHLARRDAPRSRRQESVSEYFGPVGKNAERSIPGLRSAPRFGTPPASASPPSDDTTITS